ncbi:MAG: hypothetical protein JXA95_11780, partial [Spirochaetales bacterium]|nr:hypothetical protein [Spirochaetales bacterium]
MLRIIILLCLTGGFLFSLDIDVEGGPALAVPVGASSAPFFTVGGGLSLTGELVLFNNFTAGLELDTLIVPLRGPDTATSFNALGFRGGFFHFPQSRLRLDYAFS